MSKPRPVQIAPSILSANFAKLGEEILRAEEAGADYIHIDVMDGRFVPPITIGADVVKALRGYTKLPFDVHLMVEHPEAQVAQFAGAGANLITFHRETTPHAHRLVHEIKDHGIMAGIALNPATPLVTVEDLLADLDLVLVMTVNPGYGGQSFIAGMVPKIERLRAMIDERGLSCRIEVDGGVNVLTSRGCAKAGADILVAGSAVYGADDLSIAVASLRG